MELSWIDELVNAERVLPSWLISEIKTHLHTNGDELMLKMVAYKSALSEPQNYASTLHKESLLRELLVLMRGEEAVRQADAQKWKAFYEFYQQEFEWLNM